MNNNTNAASLLQELVDSVEDWEFSLALKLELDGNR